MRIFLNQQEKEIESLSISDMLQELSIQSVGIAIAVNNKVVPRSEWTHYLLTEKDKVIIIRATQGG